MAVTDDRLRSILATPGIETIETPSMSQMVVGLLISEMKEMAKELLERRAREGEDQ